MGFRKGLDREGGIRIRQTQNKSDPINKKASSKRNWFSLETKEI